MKAMVTVENITTSEPTNRVATQRNQQLNPTTLGASIGRAQSQKTQRYQMRLSKTFSGIAMFALFVCSAVVIAQEHGEHKEGGESHEHGEHQRAKKVEAQPTVVAKTQQEIQAHADKLYAVAKLSRNDLREMRILAGLHAHASGPHIDPEGHHANDSPAQQRRESNEGEGHEDGNARGGDREHREGGERGHREGGERGHREGGERGHREGGERGHREDGERGHAEGNERSETKPGARIAKGTKHALKYKNGAKLTLQYNPATQAFVGNVTNTTKKTMSDVRVEIHLSNGVELGPTKRTSVEAGKNISVELGAFGQNFSHWTTHPEAGNEAEHAEGDEENERAGGHGGEGGSHAEREKGEHGREGRGEHAERERGEKSGTHRHDGAGEGGHGLGDASLRPVYNQLNLLRGEMQAFAADLKAQKNKN